MREVQSERFTAQYLSPLLRGGNVDCWWKERKCQIHLNSCQFRNMTARCKFLDTSAKFSNPTSLCTNNRIWHNSGWSWPNHDSYGAPYTHYISKGYYTLTFTQGKKSQFWSCLFISWPFSALPVFLCSFLAAFCNLSCSNTSSYTSSLFHMRIYIQQHTPQKGIRPILDTVLRMKGWATEFDTSQLGEVTNTMSHITALSSHNHHETRWAPTTTIDDWPRGPTTRIDERPRGPTRGHDDQQMANSTINYSSISNLSWMMRTKAFEHVAWWKHGENIRRWWGVLLMLGKLLIVSPTELTLTYL